MPPKTIRFEMIPADLALAKYENVTLYTHLKHTCCYSLHHPPDFSVFIKQLDEDLKPEEEDLQRAIVERKDPNAILELGFRLLGGCRVANPSIEGALSMFDALTDRDMAGSRYVGDRAPRELRAKAHSGAASAYWLEICRLQDESTRAQILIDRELYRRPFNTRGFDNQDAIFFAAENANNSAKLGLASSAAIAVGISVVEIAEKLGVDMLRAERLRPLARMLERHEAERRLKEQRWEKREQDERAYTCAARGCKVGGVHKSALKACAGPCPPEVKPHYCSKECQKRNWPSHRSVCKPGPVGQHLSAGPSEGSADVADVLDDLRALTLNTSETESQAELGGKWLSGPEVAAQLEAGRQHVVNIPSGRDGEEFRVISSTMLPTEMRKMREDAANGRWYFQVPSDRID